MSEPTSPEVDVNNAHTPVVPHPTDEAGIDVAVQAALVAFAAASNLDELKSARLAHTGEKSPLSLANREIGRLDKSEKAVAGKLMGASRGRVNKALAARTVVLEEEDAARILLEETVDVTAAPRRRRAGARHPLSTLQDRVSDIFVGMGW
ncbi:MAG: phenylalanine--tRNA ligase subunit alpha, partial [Paeniglutamicibacter terrestris]